MVGKEKEMEYQEFLKSKINVERPAGMDITEDDINPILFNPINNLMIGSHFIMDS